jgi:hypothetical protein
VHILWTNTEGEYTSEIKKNSFSFCDGSCINLEKAYNIDISENVFYNGQRFMIKAMEVKETTISNNLFIAIRQRIAPSSVDTHLWDPTAAIYMYTPYTAADSLSVTGNLL